MTAACAAQIAEWSDASKRAACGLSPDGGATAELVSGESYACPDSRNAPAGYFCFGNSARIPAAENYAYAEGAPDMGPGMRPDLCGQGFGSAFVKAGPEFARLAFSPEPIRLPVAAGSPRAVRTYLQAGFLYEAGVTRRRTRKLFHILVRRVEKGA